VQNSQYVKTKVSSRAFKLHPDWIYTQLGSWCDFVEVMKIMYYSQGTLCINLLNYENMIKLFPWQ
jgi:hypothetical protein